MARTSKPIGMRNVYEMEGSQGQRNANSTVSRVVNMYANPPASPNAMFGGGARKSSHRYGIDTHATGFGVGDHVDRRNSSFRAGNPHAGGSAPPGRHIPEYWGGNWAGGNGPVNVPAASKAAPVSSAAKYARCEKKKERQEKISAKSSGCAWGAGAPIPLGRTECVQIRASCGISSEIKSWDTVSNMGKFL